jgi:hypothetical protein
MRNEVALGFRAHSGHAVLVAVGGPRADVSIWLRRRVVLCRETPRQPFHHAEGRPFGEAERLIAKAVAETNYLAATSLAEAIDELKAKGGDPTAAGLLTAAGRPLPDLGAILASHALIHAAEGELFRDALRSAVRGAGLRLFEAKDRDIEPVVAASFPGGAGELKARLTGWGKELGPPWTQDEKRAALVAWLARFGPKGRR